MLSSYLVHDNNTYKSQVFQKRMPEKYSEKLLMYLGAIELKAFLAGEENSLNRHDVFYYALDSVPEELSPEESRLAREVLECRFRETKSHCYVG